MKKIIFLFIFSVSLTSLNYSQPTISGQFVVETNNGTNYIVKVQIKSSSGTDILGDATIPFTFNTLDISYVSTTFSNFSGGAYYSATATNSPSDRISLNIEYNTGTGTTVSSTFMNVATITFSTIDPAGYSQLAFSTPLEFFNTAGDVQWTNGTFNGEDTHPLPIELTSLEANNYEKNNVKLSWKTSTEVNNYGFEVERSLTPTPSQREGAFNWVKIGFVQGSGNSNSPQEYSFIDPKLNTGKYNYRLKMIDIDGTFEFSDVVDVEVGLPKQYAISQNYPNPFNPTTRIDYQLPFDSKVTIELYAITGERVASLTNEELAGGYYTADVNANVLNLASGVYFCRMIAQDLSKNNAKTFIQIKKLMLMK